MNGRVTSHHAVVYQLMYQEASQDELMPCDVTLGI